MKKQMIKMAFMSLLAVFVFACKPNEEVKFTNVKVEVEFPDDYAESKENVEIKWENISSKASGEAKTDASGVATFMIEEGNYNIFASKRVKAVHYQGKTENLNVASQNQTVKITLETSYTSTSWVIKEVYFAGSKTVADKSYRQDQYIEIYNNSRETLYADGLIFCKTYDNTMGNPNWGQYVEKGQIVPYFIFQVPGNGKEYPVAPGKSVVLADQGLNHKNENPLSPVDLSKADFEWYDEYKLDVDVSEVPNMIKRYSGSLSINMLHMRGYEGYFIAQIPTAETEIFLKNHTASTVMPNGKTIESYAFPIEYIIDGVQCAAPDGYTSAVFPASIDAGYTFCNDGGSGKCVQRKFLKTEKGVDVLQDTNNSTNDFTANATPSPRVVVK